MAGWAAARSAAECWEANAMSWLSSMFGGGNNSKGTAKRAAKADKNAEDRAKKTEERRARVYGKTIKNENKRAKKDDKKRDAQRRNELAALERRHAQSQKSQGAAYDRATKQAQRQFRELIDSIPVPETPEPRAAPLQPDAGAEQVKAARSSRTRRRKKGGVSALILSSLAGGGSLGA